MSRPSPSEETASAYGFMNVDKPAGWTSHDVVAKVRSTLDQKRVGHTGTLDPLATGVLVLCLGAATRLARFLPEQWKTYEAQMRLGVSTDTQDRQGRVVRERPFTGGEPEIRAAFSGFVGDITQVPPKVSAVKVDGKALYRWWRQGVDVKVAPRKATIAELRVGGSSLGREPAVRFTVRCSKGTYVRTLCNDVGEKLGCGAHLTELRRVASGDFKVDRAASLETVVDRAREGTIEELIAEPEEVLSSYPQLAVDESAATAVLHGAKLRESMIVSRDPGLKSGDLARVVDRDHKLLAMAEVSESALSGRHGPVLARSVWVRPNRV
ncbi:MAG: tRNA pseudouridine(55) synthase TruB [Terriglobia bacterium]